jgi:hypothetical protein
MDGHIFMRFGVDIMVQMLSQTRTFYPVFGYTNVTDVHIREVGGLSSVISPLPMILGDY